MCNKNFRKRVYIMTQIGSNFNHQNIENVPQELRDRPQWINWEYEKDKDGKWKKPPVNSEDYRIDPTDPDNHLSFDEAVRIAKEKGFGIGFVFTEDDPYIGIDFDGCFDDAGNLCPRGGEDLELLNSYAEKSPSGKGLHVIAEHSNVDAHKTKDIEIYSKERYFTFTGDKYSQTSEVRTLNGEVDQLIEKYPKKSGMSLPTKRVATTDESIIKRMLESKDGKRQHIKDAWSGDYSHYDEDRSRGDSAVAFELCYWTDSNADQIERIMRSNPNIYRNKWDEKRKNSTWLRQGCIEPAIKKCQSEEKNKIDDHLADQNLETVEDGTPSIIVNRQPAAVIADMQKLIQQLNGDSPITFVRNGKLVRAVKNDNTTLIEDHTKQSLSYHLNTKATWLRKNQTKDSYSDTKAPAEFVEQILSSNDFDGIPSLRGIKTSPIFTSRGQIRLESGYDPDTGYYIDHNIEIGDITPTEDNIRRAKELIFDDLLVDFPFVSDADKAHAVAFMLLPFVQLITGNITPLHVFKAPTARTGKSKLMKLLLLPSIGTLQLNMMKLSNGVFEASDLRKELVSFARSGRSACLFDNVKGTIDSDLLELAITSGRINERILGGNQTTDAPTNWVWALSSNDAKLSNDLIGRSILIQLDANMEFPSERSGFKHPDIEQWSLNHLGELTTGCLALVNAWVEAGMPLDEESKFGGFEQWCKVMGGLLKSIGIDGFLQNEQEKRLSTQSTETESLRNFVQTWGERFRETTVGVKELFPLASYTDSSGGIDNGTSKMHRGHGENLLGELIYARSERGRSTKLGIIIREKLVGKVYADWRVVEAEGNAKNGAKMYQLIHPKP